MSTGPSRQPRPVSFYLAIGVAAACLIAVAFIVVRAVTSSPAPSPTAHGDAFASGTDEGVLGEDGGAKGLHIQMMDRDNKDRLSAELMSDTIDPTKFQRFNYSVTNPRATIYLQDGRVVHISARAGTLVMPDRTKAPETGTLTDDVVVRLFDRHEDGTAPDVDRDDPAMTWTGSKLTFDSTLGEVSTDQSWVLTSPDYECHANDGKLLINQALERLERFTIRKGGTIVYTDHREASASETARVRPARDRGAARIVLAAFQASDAQPGGAPGGTAGPAGAAREAAPPVVTYYQAAMHDGVVLSREGQEVRSDRLDVYARTVDSKLPDRAIAPFPASPGAGSAPEDRVGEDGPAPVVPAAPPEPDAGGEAAGGAGMLPVAALWQPEGDTPEEPAPPTTTLTWTGVLEVRPLSAQPPELEGDDLLARFTSEQSGVVSFSDAASEASGRAAVVEYGFTSARLVLSGPSQGRSVLVSSPRLGEATMGRFELPLKTGEATIPGPFTVVGTDGVSRIDSGERARLLFAMRDGRLTGQLLEAEFIGAAKAADADASLEANRLLATFDPTEDGKSELARLVAIENVRLDDGKGASGRCDMLDTRFAGGESQPTPESFTAEGGVSFRDQTAKIDAQHLHALLRKGESGAIGVARAWAEGKVEFRRYTDRVAISGERLFADADEQYLEVGDDGGGAVVARGPTKIGGGTVQLNGLERSATVRGAGSFEHSAGKGDQASSVVASWSEGMAFDDTQGKLECVGDVVADHRPDVFTREHIRASVLRVELEPASGGVEAGVPQAPGESTAAVESDRPIRTVYAAGREPAEGETPDDAWRLATFESARYAAAMGAGEDGAAGDSEAEPKLERAFRLSGTEILADNVGGTLDVPGRGRLLVADLRAQPEDDPNAQRGAALFDWSGSMHADRNAGEAEMHEGVQMAHTSSTTGSKTVLDCQRLRVTFTPTEKADGADPEDLFGGLRSAVAEREVYLRTDTREMTADLLLYDPDAGIAKAVGDSFDGVRILDRATGSPMTASAMIWNLTTDRVDIVDPTTITIPRSGE